MNRAAIYVYSTQQERINLAVFFINPILQGRAVITYSEDASISVAKNM